jgi:hypothetical protein
MERLLIEWTPVHLTDDRQDLPDENDEGFWPSLDRKAAGWIGDNPERSFAEQWRPPKNAWRPSSGAIGVISESVARAALAIPIGQGCRRLMTVESAGLWGIESDSDAEYLASVFADEQEHTEGRANDARPAVVGWRDRGKGVGRCLRLRKSPKSDRCRPPSTGGRQRGSLRHMAPAACSWRSWPPWRSPTWPDM